MTDFIKLPHRVDASVLDVEATVAAIESGALVLDWSDVDDIDHDTCRQLLEPFLDRIGPFADALGLASMPEVIEPDIDWIFGTGPKPEPRPKAWMVMQAATSTYDDLDGEHYEYPPTIPNGRRLSVGDRVLCINSAREATDDRRIFGVASIASITDRDDDRRRAVYADYRPIEPPLTFDDIGGDPRPNPSNSINRIPTVVVEGVEAALGGEAPATTSPLDSIDLTSAAGVRDAFHRIVELDLLGPATGPDEELLDDPPRTRYVVGTLAPKNDTVDALVTDDSLGGAGESRSGQAATGEGDVEPAGPPSDTLFASTIGLTFAVAAEVDTISIEATWGSYDRVESEQYFTDDGNARMVWRRTPRGGMMSLGLTPGPIEPWSPDSESPDVRVRGIVRPPGPDGSRLVTVFLVNDQRVKKEELLKDRKWVFQPQIRVTPPDGASAVFVRRDHDTDLDQLDGIEEEERALLAMMHRKHAEFAIGHGVAVHAEPAADPWDDDAGWDRAIEIRTAVLPWHDVAATETPSNAELAHDFPGFEGFVLDMAELAAMDREDLAPVLRRIPLAYSRWIERERARIGGDGDTDLAPHRAAARIALDRADTARKRLEEGIDLIADEQSVAFDAFRFANQAMRLQRLRSVYALRRRREPDLTFDDVEASEPAEWRAFQLAFVLLNIPTVTRLDHPKRTQAVGSYADLLWFPTGGGKTEAYLGVAAFTIGVRRLQGRVDGYEGDGGATVIMRYTLRLLTLQQFQRAATLVCALEYLRTTQLLDDGRSKWGNEPFRIGLWVGNSSTPGTTDAASKWISTEKGATKWDAGAGTSSPLQLTNCPWCGTRVGPDDLASETYGSGRGRTLLYCHDKNCDFNRKNRRDEGIPVVTVDEEIYRLVPTFLLATVDKFAQMPWRGDVQALFGRVSGRCDRHGWLGSEAECSGTHNKKGRLPATNPQPVPPKGLRPPDLIIQDELHLISGPLGTLVGLYETAIDELCTWETGGNRVRPKVIASTATTRRAPEQVHRLFCRQVEVFPPSGLDADDNFFARQRRPNAEKPGRRYMGVCAPGRSRPAVLIRVYVALLAAAQWLWDETDEDHRHLVDPYMTLVGYFNSLRELGGMRRLVDDDVSTRVFRVERADRPGMAQRVMYPETTVQELTSRIRSSQIPTILDRLEDSFVAETEADTDESRKPRRPLDAVLATNMLSVGVDVQRLGVMAVSGQPKTTAEYIQATSRVGRRAPGFVVTVLNWARPRDLSHYEQFEQYHAVFYRYVEALSVTPFAPRALDRGLTGVLASLVRLSGTTYNHNHGAGLVKGAGQFPDIIDVIGDRASNGTFPEESTAEIGSNVKQAVKAKLDLWGAEASKLDRKLGYRDPFRKDDVTVGLLQPPGNGPWEPFTTPVSMREVEPNVGLVLQSPAGDLLPDWDFTTPPAEGDSAS